MKNLKNRFSLSAIVFVELLILGQPAQASLFQGETLDAVADGISWVVLVVVPVTVIILFWLVHILPEKVAEKNKHPQAKAIQVLCLLSLAFGGLLWPLAWLWAYSKPVLYKMAYGADTVEHEPSEPEQAQADISASGSARSEVESQRSHIKVVELERQPAAQTNPSSERS